MDITSLEHWLDVVFKVMVAIFSIWLFFDRRNDKTNDRIDSHDNRLTAIEVALRIQPSHTELADVHNHIRSVSAEVAKVNNSLASLTATLDSLKDQVKLMDNFWRTRNPTP
jgi:septal ring factor EnvC (AmiA/AmiB activator)